MALWTISRNGPPGVVLEESGIQVWRRGMGLLRGDTLPPADQVTNPKHIMAATSVAPKNYNWCAMLVHMSARCRGQWSCHVRAKSGNIEKRASTGAQDGMIGWNINKARHGFFGVISVD